jgi:hypothetical protein
MSKDPTPGQKKKQKSMARAMRKDFKKVSKMKKLK